MNRSFLLLLVLLTGCGFRSEHADLVIHNARLHTLDEQGTIAQAVAIRDGRIVEIGAERQILNKYAADRVFDAAGRSVYPGFIDGHCHFLGYGLNAQKVDLLGTKDWDKAVDRVVSHAKDHPGTKWLLGRGWDQNTWPDRTMPDNERLNLLFPDRPVLLQRVDGHAAVVNDAAMRAVGLDPFKTVEGGLVVTRNGRATGLLVDNAVSVFQTIFDEADEATKRKALLDAQAACFEAGLTMVVDAGLDTGSIALIRRMQKEGVLKMRIYAMVADAPGNLAHFSGSGPIAEERLWVRSVKVYADGALGSRGALLKAPYSDQHGHHGLQLATREHFAEVANWCKENGFQMNTHCIGDSANKLLLDVYAETLRGTNDLRWRIEHAQVVAPEDRPLFAAYSIIPSVQPTHATSDGPWAQERLGPQRVEHAYAYKDLLGTLGILALGTDFPVEGIDPLQTYRSAVLRRSADGWPNEGFQVDNALTPDQALRGMTIWNAIATFTEKDLGTIEVGKFADLTVVDRDLAASDAAALNKAKVVATFVNGEQVH
jgi:predicted amidohydrolase YtcJ